VVVALTNVLSTLAAAAPLARVTLSTYHACVSAGKKGLDELWEQTLAVFNQKEMPHEAFARQVAFNVVPQVDVFLENGTTKEEERIMRETRRVLGMPGLRIAATSVRVPVLHCDSIALNVEFSAPLSAPDAAALLAGNPAITVIADPEEAPTAVDTAASDTVQVGRLRADPSVAHGLQMWIVSDGLRRGTAFNALKLATRLCEASGA
jgi:aspartate-semialdehyde dehydrogenase